MRKSKKQTDLKAYNYLLVAGVLWGFSSLFYKKSLIALSIVVFLALRFSIGAVYIFVAERKKFKKISVKLLGLVVAFALFDAVLVNYVFSYAIQRTTILHASIISLAVPFLVYFFAALILKERPHRVVVLGGLIAAGGLGFIVLGGQAEPSATASMVKGDAFMVGYAVINALSIVIGRRILSHKKLLPTEQFSFIEYAASAVFFIAIASYSSLWGQLQAVSLSTYGWIVGAAIISGGIPVLLYYRSVKRLPAERLADISFISPAVAGCVGVVFLGEEMTTNFIIGTTFVVFGLLVSHKKIHPILVAHRIGSDVRTLEQVYRVPKRAYEYISIETRNSFR